MRIELTTRGLLAALFRQRIKFLTVFLLILLGGSAYMYSTAPAYRASGSLLVKFGQDGALDVARAGSGGPSVISQNDRREIMQSNIYILQSHDLLLSAVRELGVESIYPDIASRGWHEEEDEEDSPDEAAVQRLTKDDLTVKSGEMSNVIEIMVYNRDPEIAARLVHKIMQLFIARQSEMDNAPQTAAFLEAEIKQAADRLARSQLELQEFKAASGISSIEEELNELLKQKTEAATVALKSIDDAWGKASDLQAEELQMMTTYREDSPQMIQMRQRVKLAVQQLQARQSELKARTGDGSSAIANINKRIALLEGQRSRHNDLVRQVTIDEEKYKNYTLRGEEARIGGLLSRNHITPITVVDEPVAPRKPVRPRKGLILAMCLLSGLVFGGGFALAAETLDQRFTTPEHVALALNLPVIASFNHGWERGRA